MKIATNVNVLEALEGRRMLSVSPTLSGRTIVVTASEGNDAVEIEFNYAVADGQVGALEDVSIYDPSDRDGDPFFEAADFDSIAVSLGAGDDVLTQAVHYFDENGDEVTSGVAPIDPATGDARPLRVDAGGGNDRVDGTAFGDYVSAGSGDDTVAGNGGNDTITGGAGRNRLYGGEGNDRLNGSNGRDFLYGEAGDDRLYGNDGNDYVDGGGGKDRAWAGAGDDSLIGGSSVDRLYGEAGNDSFVGGPGNDYLFGGDGADVNRSFDAGDVVDSVEAIG